MLLVAVAVAMKSRPGILQMARLLASGMGCRQDTAKAFALVSELAAQGEKNSCYELGRFYENGIGTLIYMDKAKAWYKKAAEQGQLDAKAALERWR